MKEQGGVTSRNIPLPVQREVRQRCGFGCVVCGLPLYEYDHIRDWAEVHAHDPKEITLLCDRHHREKTGGLLPVDRVREANADPYNLRAGVSSPYNLHFGGSSAKVDIGTNTFGCEDMVEGQPLVALQVDNTPLLGFVFQDEHLLLHLNVFDEHNACVLRIVNNHLLYTTVPWDIQLTGTRLVVREGPGKIFMDVLFEPPGKVKVSRGRFLRNGVEVLVRPTNVLVTNSPFVIQQNSAANCPGGIYLGEATAAVPACFHLGGIPRYFGDRSEAIEFEKECVELYG